MGQTAFYSPVHRVLGRMANAGAVPPSAAPNQDFLGNGLQDHRLPYNTGFGGVGVLGWYGADPCLCLNQAPAALGAAKLAALAHVAAGVAMTLANASTGVTVLAANTLLLPSLVIPTAGALVLDGLPARKLFGSASNSGGFVSAFYDRTTMISRAVSVTGAAGGAGGDFKVYGYDAYGYAMEETITATAGATSVNGKKAFKIVSSIVPQFTDAHNYSFGTTDIFGLPLRANSFGEVLLHWDDALLTASTGFVAGVATDPATATTGDVRGTYAVQSAADGAKKLVARVSPSLTLIQANATTGLFGVAQYAG